MSPKTMAIFQEGKKVLQDELRIVDASISDLESKPYTSHPSDSPAIVLLMQGRDRLQALLEQIDAVIENIRQIDAGQPLKNGVHGSKQENGPRPGQYAGMKLSTAAQAYLVERNRGPVLLTKMLQDLTTAGVLIGDDRKTPTTRHLRMMCANNRKRFFYDNMADTINLRTAPGNDTGRVPN